MSAMAFKSFKAMTASTTTAKKSDPASSAAADKGEGEGEDAAEMSAEVQAAKKVEAKAIREAATRAAAAALAQAVASGKCVVLPDPTTEVLAAKTEAIDATDASSSSSSSADSESADGASSGVTGNTPADQENERADEEELARVKATVSLAHRMLGGVTKGSALVLNPEVLPGGVVFYCHKLKLKPTEYGVKKLNEVPRLPRAVVVTRDRLLVLQLVSNQQDGADASPDSAGSDFLIQGGDAAAAAAPAPGSLEAAEMAMAKAQAKQTQSAGDAASSTISSGGTSSAETAKEGDMVGGGGSATSANAAAVPEQETEEEVLKSAAELVGCHCVVKSNHHLTEIVKMTLLKRVKKSPHVCLLLACVYVCAIQPQQLSAFFDTPLGFTPCSLSLDAKGGDSCSSVLLCVKS
jgi:hypothetical protein